MRFAMKSCAGLLITHHPHFEGCYQRTRQISPLGTEVGSGYLKPRGQISHAVLRTNEQISSIQQNSGVTMMLSFQDKMGDLNIVPGPVQPRSYTRP